MKPFDIEKMILETRCQHCAGDVPRITPLKQFLTPADGIWSVPDVLRCAKCGMFVTQQVRERRKDEKTAVEKIAIEAAAEVLVDAVTDIDAAAVDSDGKKETS